MPPSDSTSASAAPAFAAALTAYLIWGVIGYYFHIITVDYGVNPFTLLANRVVWSLVFVLIILGLRRDLPVLVDALRNRKLVAQLALSSVLVATNWMIFIYAAATGRLVPASLGYFLTPLLSVLLGVVLLRERLRPWQVAAIAIACVGIALITYLRASSMWIPIGLMFSFAFYGLVRKQTVVGPIVGLAVETALLAPLAIAFIATFPPARPMALVPAAHALLVAAGVITAVPLILFNYAARRLRLITIGLLQFAGPTVQFLVALFAGEHVTRQELLAFAIIWVGLTVFAIDAILGHRAKQRSAAATIAETPAAAIAAPLQSRT